MLMIAMLTAPTSTEDGARDPATGPLIDVVVPVYNEQAIARAVDPPAARVPRRPAPVRVADRDRRQRQHRRAPRDRRRAGRSSCRTSSYLRLAAKGRGRALRAAWSRSDADVARLHGRRPVDRPRARCCRWSRRSLSGHSDVAIGTRLAPGSRVVRGPKRELISRSYNRLLRTSSARRFSDAQCGFKAIRARRRARAAPAGRRRRLVLRHRAARPRPATRAAHPRGRRSTGSTTPTRASTIVPTALDDLRGVARLVLQQGSRASRSSASPRRSPTPLLYLLLRAALGAGLAPTPLALAVTAVANTQANRRVTFDLRGADGLLAQHAAGLAAFALALALTDGALAALTALDRGASRALETSVLVVASAAGTVGRYLALRLVLSRGAAAAPRRPSSLRFARRAARDQRRSRRYARGRPASPAQPCPEPPGQP